MLGQLGKTVIPLPLVINDYVVHNQQQLNLLNL